MARTYTKSELADLRRKKQAGRGLSQQDDRALQEARSLGTSFGSGGIASTRRGGRIAGVTGTWGQPAYTVLGSRGMTGPGRRSSQGQQNQQPVAGNPSDKEKLQPGTARGSSVVENKDGTRTIYSPGGFRVVGGGKPSPNAVTTDKSPTGAKEWSNWKKGFFADGTPAGALFQFMDAGGMRYGKDGKPLAVTTEHWSEAKKTKDALGRLVESQKDIRGRIGDMKSLGAGMVADASGQLGGQIIDVLRGIRSASENNAETAKTIGNAFERGKSDEAFGTALKDWRVDPDAAANPLRDAGRQTVIPEGYSRTEYKDGSASVSYKLSAEDQKGLAEAWAKGAEAGRAFEQGLKERMSPKTTTAAERNVGQAVDDLVEGMKQEIDRQFEAGRPEGSRVPGLGPVKHAEDAQDRANARMDDALGAQANGTGTMAQTNDAIDSATQAARAETEASKQRAAETRARTARFRQESAAKNAADEEFIRQMKARLGQADYGGGMSQRAHADWDGGMSSRARRFIESRRAEVAERLSRYRTRAADGGGTSIGEATAQKRKEMVQATATRQYEALMKFGDRNYRARMERLFNAALDDDARDAAMLDEYDRVAEANRARVAKSGLARYDELTAKGREKYAGGRWEKLMNEHTSPTWAMPAGPVASRGEPRQGLVARAKEALGVARDLAGLMVDGTKKTYGLDDVHRGAALLARPSATSGIKEIDQGLRRVPVVVNGRLDEGGRLRRMTDADRRDVSKQSLEIGLREDAKGGSARRSARKALLARK